MNDTEMIDVEIEDATGIVHGPIRAFDRDPSYFIENSEFLKSLILERGRLIFLCQGNRRQRRIIAGVNETSLGNVQFIAPKRTTRIKRNSEYVKWRDVPIRPGSMVLGGRNTAFYDNYGVILDAFPTGGNHEKFEDWIYRVAAPLYSAWSATAQWILIDDIGPDVQGPGSLIELSPHPNSLVDGFLVTAQREMIEHIARNPDAISHLTPKRFEDLVEAIYKNVGFTTERVSAWNQSDGGVDILAVSKSPASTEFRLAIQCRTSKNKLQANVIRESCGGA